jgi:hypothetical protein
MLFQILKLLGLDVPAKIEALKAGLERRIEQAADRIKEAARRTAVVVFLSTFAAIMGAMAFGTGLVALYLWTAERYGPYGGLAAVGGILVVATMALATAAAREANSLTSAGPNLPRDATATTGVASRAEPIEADSEARPAAVEAGPGFAASTPLVPNRFRQRPRRAPGVCNVEGRKIPPHWRPPGRRIDRTSPYDRPSRNRRGDRACRGCRAAW